MERYWKYQTVIRNGKWIIAIWNGPLLVGGNKGRQIEEVLKGEREIHIQSQRGHGAAMFGSAVVEHGAKPVLEGS